MKATIALIAALCLAACSDEIFSIDLERMIEQKRYASYEASEFFADGRSMRSPPADTVARSRVINNPALTEGVVDGAYVTRIPIELNRELVDQGRDRYETFCSPCHGIAADGDSIVAASMLQRRPPSLVDPRVRAFPVGHVFQVITHGYGLMRPYSDDLAIDERWATIAYLRALQLRSGVTIDSLAPALRQRAKKELP